MTSNHLCSRKYAPCLNSQRPGPQIHSSSNKKVSCVVRLFDSPVFNSNLIGQFFLLIIIENQLAEITECELNCREALCGQEQT